MNFPSNNHFPFIHHPFLLYNLIKKRKHGISAFGAVPCDNSQTNHRSDFWKEGFVVNHEPADLFDVHINSILSLVGVRRRSALL